MPMLEETGRIPSERYAHQPEIYEHLRDLAQKFDLYDDALLQTEAVSMTWDEEAEHWTVATNRDDTVRARYLVVAPGDQHTPRLPAIPGIESFTGAMFHTARFDWDYTGPDLQNLADKRVAVIGTGATGLQVIPEVAKAAGHLSVFQRMLSTVLVRDNRPTPPEFADSLEPGWQHKRINSFTNALYDPKGRDGVVEDGWTFSFGRLMKPIFAGKPMDSPEAEAADYEVMEVVGSWVDEIVEDPAVAAALKPYYRYTCKLLGFHDEYLAAFNRENVTLVDTKGRGVEKFVQGGVVVDGEEHGSTASSSRPGSTLAPAMSTLTRSGWRVATTPSCRRSGRTACARSTGCTRGTSRTASSWA